MILTLLALLIGVVVTALVKRGRRYAAVRRNLHLALREHPDATHRRH